MDLVRKIAVAIVMIVPTFVFSGLIWAAVPSWLVVLGVMIVMAVIYSMIIRGKFRRTQNA